MLTFSLITFGTFKVRYSCRECRKAGKKAGNIYDIDQTAP